MRTYLGELLVAHAETREETVTQDSAVRALAVVTALSHVQERRRAVVVAVIVLTGLNQVSRGAVARDIRLQSRNRKIDFIKFQSKISELDGTSLTV